MLAYSEMIYCLTQNQDTLWEDDALLSLLDEVEQVYSASDIRQTIERIKKLREHKTDTGAQDELKQKITGLTNRIKEEKPSEGTLPSNQQWYLEIIEKAGYSVRMNFNSFSLAGWCYGMVAMAEQAFLANDIPTFNRRLYAINKLDPTQINPHLDGLPTKERIDLLAFFDGVQFNHDAYIYGKLFDVSTKTQDARITMPITRSLLSDQPDKQPALICSFSGAYNPSELLQYLVLLQKYIGAYTFALRLGSVGHEIGLFYNHTTQRWLLVDPEHLPGEEYIHAELVRDALLIYFSQKPNHKMSGLVMVTNLDATFESKTQIDDCFFQMSQSENWKQLHCVSKLNCSYDEKKTLFNTAIRNGETQWVKEALTTQNDIIQKNESAISAALGSNDITMLKLLIEHGFNFDHHYLLAIDTCKDLLNPLLTDYLIDHCKVEELFIYACKKNSLSLLESLVPKTFTPSVGALDEVWRAENIDPDLIQFFQSKNWLPSTGYEGLFIYACKKNLLIQFEKLLPPNFVPSSDALDEVWCTKNISPDLMQLLQKNNWLSSIKGFGQLIKSGCVSSISYLIEQGASLPDISQTWLEADPSVLELLIKKQLWHPTQDMLLDACKNSRSSIVRFLIEKQYVKPIPEMISPLFQKYCSERDGAGMEIIGLLATSINFVPNTEMMEHAIDMGGYNDLLTLFIFHGGHTTDKMLRAVCTAQAFILFFFEDTLNLLLSHGACITPDIFDFICEKNDSTLTRFFSEKLIKSIFKEAELDETEKKCLDSKIEQWVSEFIEDTDITTTRDYQTLCQKVLSGLEANRDTGIDNNKLSAIITNLEEKIDNNTNRINYAIY